MSRPCGLLVLVLPPALLALAPRAQAQVNPDAVRSYAPAEVRAGANPGFRDSVRWAGCAGQPWRFTRIGAVLAPGSSDRSAELRRSSGLSSERGAIQSPTLA